MTTPLYLKYMPLEQGDITQGMVFHRHYGFGQTRSVHVSGGIDVPYFVSAQTYQYMIPLADVFKDLFPAGLQVCSHKIVEGSRVWWTDPDEGNASDFFTVVKIGCPSDEIDEDTIILVKNEHSEAEVRREELDVIVGEISPKAIWAMAKPDKLCEDPYIELDHTYGPLCCPTCGSLFTNKKEYL